MNKTKITESNEVMRLFELINGNGEQVDEGYFTDLKAALKGLKDSYHKGEYILKYGNKKLAVTLGA